MAGTHYPCQTQSRPPTRCCFNLRAKRTSARVRMPHVAGPKEFTQTPSRADCFAARVPQGRCAHQLVAYAAQHAAERPAELGKLAQQLRTQKAAARPAR